MTSTQPPVPSQNAQESKSRTWLIFGAVALLGAIVFGLLYLFVLAPSVPDGSIGWYLFSFATGLTMIVLPCTLPLAFVIVPLSMGKGLVRGLGMALAFGLGVAATLSVYGIVAALLGGVAIDALGADLESVKNWVYFVAGIFALVFALSEIGLMNIHMPTYSGAAPAFIQKRGEIIKAFLLGLFLGNVGVGCPHPATPLILIEIASSGDILYGWIMFLTHAVGRILPLLLLAFLAILGVNGLNWLMARKDAVERTTGWAMVFVAGFILTLGLFSHDWWVNSGLHSGLETITQEQYFNQLLNETLDQNVAHVHGLEEGEGLFGLPLEWGNWFLVLVWLIPIWWWYRKRKHEAETGAAPCDMRVLKVKRNFLIVISIFIILTFTHFLPKNFYLTAISGVGHDDHGDHGDEHMMEDGTMMSNAMMLGEAYGQDPSGLPQATEPETVVLEDGDSYDITAAYVQKEVGNRTLRMLAYNGSVPGPFIKSTEGAEVTINFTNNTDLDQTIHSHGIRLANTEDGVPGVTQHTVPPGGSHTYTILFEDGGVFWYHPHTRDDYGQEMGLYGNYIVEPTSGYNTLVNREIPLVIDDILIENDRIAPFYKDVTNFALLGRFGNEFLVNGQQNYTLTAKAGEVLRFFVTNVSNARTYNLSIPGARLKLVAADIGKFEREFFAEEFLISPAERVVAEAYFEEPGVYQLMHTMPDGEVELVRFVVGGEAANPSYGDEFAELAVNEAVVNEFSPFRSYLAKEPDKSLLLTIDLMDGMVDHSEHAHGAAADATVDHDDHAHMMENSDPQMSIQWDDANQSDRMNTTHMILWKLVDQDTGKVNMDIDDWEFTAGDLVKVRLENDAEADHVMQHPIHFHGQQFVVLARNGEPNANLAWKDTVLVLPGETVDILVDMSNLGEWMNHCHISEHLHAGMMMQFRVEDENGYATGDEFRASLPPSATTESNHHADMMESMTESKTFEPSRSYSFSDINLVDSSYKVIPGVKVLRSANEISLPLTFRDQEGNSVSLSTAVDQPLTVTFVKSDNSVSFVTYPGNRTFMMPTDGDDGHGHNDGHDHEHSFLGTPVAYAAGDDGHDHQHEAAMTGDYSIPVFFPERGVYRGFVEFVVAGEQEPRLAYFDMEVTGSGFTVDQFGWSDAMKWWVLFLGSIFLTVPLVWLVRRYINVAKV